MNKFIKLTTSTDTPIGNKEIYLSSMLITVIEPTSTSNPYEAQTRVHMMGGQWWGVLETVEEIRKKLGDLDKFVYFDPILPKNK